MRRPVIASPHLPMVGKEMCGSHIQRGEDVFVCPLLKRFPGNFFHSCCQQIVTRIGIRVFRPRHETEVLLVPDHAKDIGKGKDLIPPPAGVLLI